MRPKAQVFTLSGMILIRISNPPHPILQPLRPAQALLNWTQTGQMEDKYWSFRGGKEIASIHNINLEAGGGCIFRCIY